MNPSLIKISLLTYSFLLISGIMIAQTKSLQFSFDQHLKGGSYEFTGKQTTYTAGVDGLALVLDPIKGYEYLSLNDLRLDGSKDFSIQCWIKTTSKKPMVILSQKDFPNKGIVAQKNEGWVLYTSGETFGWSIGSGDRRINYERDNGKIMPISNGEWHQMTITYRKKLAEFRLYYDGQNKAIYKVNFNFANTEPLIIGTSKDASKSDPKYSVDIESGLLQLQTFVDQFNELGLEPLKNDEFLDLIVDPEKVFNRKQEHRSESQKISTDRLAKALEIRRELSTNPYTVFQNRALTELKPISKIYALQTGKVVINDAVAKSFTQEEILYPSDFAIDNLSILEETMDAAEIFASYSDYQKVKKLKVPKKLKKLNVGVWNIWHGGIHWTQEKDGWDSRLRIAEMIKEKNLDLVLLQETYSSGDFIAAELGYYFATSSDWDYKFQGANISVISRYPIKEVQVSEETEFNNVAVKLAISKTQEVWAMSNWYGMGQFPAVFDFHQSRFKNSDQVPVLFGGDFNAVPHTDGGDSPASKSLLDAGFTDAFRSLNPDIEKNPGISHRSGVRIDQLYYKGKGLSNTLTETVSTWPSGFPSDHYLIVAKFKLKY